MSVPSLQRIVELPAVSAYAAEAVGQMPRLLGALDREPDSRSGGSFDREHWAWKFRDFPMTMLQTSVYPLALVWRHAFADNPYHRNPRVLGWIEAAIENTRRRQRNNGAFDSLAPFTQDHGVTLAVVYALVEVDRLLGDDLSPGCRSAIRDVVRRACEFALVSREDHAFISNHQALFAISFLNGYEVLGEPRLETRAEEIVDRILRAQSPDGWYREYEGPDPGYESLGIFYLATYWRRTRSASVLASLERSLEFYSHCVHPDGSIGGGYSSRQTSLYFPGGIEMLSGEIPLASAIARFLRARLRCQNVVTPATSDMHNLPSLLVTYLEAALAGDDERIAPPLLPCETLEGLRRFGESGIVAVGRRRYYAVVNAARGGVCRVFDKQTGKLAYEDAGYLVRAGRRSWTSQRLGLGHQIETPDAQEVACQTQLAEIRQLLPTPALFLLLRLLNLTVFRAVAVGAWVRRLIVSRLITRADAGPFRFARTIRFDADEIHVRDTLEMLAPGRVDEVSLPRSFTAAHMGSAKYFHASELDETLRVSCTSLASELTRSGGARCEFSLRFAVSGPELVRGPGADRSLVQTEALTGR